MTGAGAQPGTAATEDRCLRVPLGGERQGGGQAVPGIVGASEFRVLTAGLVDLDLETFEGADGMRTTSSTTGFCCSSMRANCIVTSWRARSRSTDTSMIVSRSHTGHGESPLAR